MTGAEPGPPHRQSESLPTSAKVESAGSLPPDALGVASFLVRRKLPTSMPLYLKKTLRKRCGAVRGLPTEGREAPVLMGGLLQPEEALPP